MEIEQATGGQTRFKHFAIERLSRPQPVTIPMVVLALIVPLYIFIGDVWMPGRVVHAPAMLLDRLIPLEPAWALVYGSLYLAILLPVFVVHQQELIRRTVRAYLMIWVIALACFLIYPTITPRPAAVAGNGFCAWVLGVIYAADTAYNCFPSLHVAQAMVSALACSRVHRGVGWVAGIWAFLIGLSTLYTKQHYVIDVVAGALLGHAAYVLFLRDYPRDGVPERERRFAPLLAAGAFGVYGLVVAGFWIAYRV